jgi:hypothetical protein
MREEGQRGTAKVRARPRPTDNGHTRSGAESLLDRPFSVTGPIPAWLSDLTNIQLLGHRGGRVLLVTVKNEQATGTYSAKSLTLVGIASYILDFCNPARRHSTLADLSRHNCAPTLMVA